MRSLILIKIFTLEKIVISCLYPINIIIVLIFQLKINIKNNVTYAANTRVLVKSTYWFQSLPNYLTLAQGSKQIASLSHHQLAPPLQQTKYRQQFRSRDNGIISFLIILSVHQLSRPRLRAHSFFLIPIPLTMFFIWI